MKVRADDYYIIQAVGSAVIVLFHYNPCKACEAKTEHLVRMFCEITGDLVAIDQSRSGGQFAVSSSHFRSARRL